MLIVERQLDQTEEIWWCLAIQRLLVRKLNISVMKIIGLWEMMNWFALRKGNGQAIRHSVIVSI